ncbi:MAG: transporter ATP-binding protein [Bacteroidota bacterium]|nr:transporter ATP-binding protein [Bacteroidota bacterium]
MKVVIKVENISKRYNLGEVGTGTLSRDINAWWARMKGKENPNLKVTETEKSGYENTFHQALSNISFNVNEGDVLGIIGKNGAGKSTLLKILSRVTTPSSGQFKVKGRIASLLEVGTGFHPDLTGRENVFLNGAILGMRKSEIRSKFDEIIEFSGVEKFIDTPVKRYSSGMYVRLAFAVAAHLEPEILIVDEVLAVGDLEFQKKCLGKMKDVSEQGRTVLFVSHNMNAMQQLCSRGILISKGSLEMDADINTVVNHYIGLAKTGAANISEFARRGNKAISFTDFYITDSGLNKVDRVMMKDDLFVNLLMKAKEEVRQLDVSFTIRNAFGEAITHVQNMDNDFIIPVNQEDYFFRIRLKDILFVPGTYFISIWAGNSTEAYDCIDNCMSFEVLNNPDLNRLIYPHNIRVFQNSQWEIAAGA